MDECGVIGDSLPDISVQFFCYTPKKLNNQVDDLSTAVYPEPKYQMHQDKSALGLAVGGTFIAAAPQFVQGCQNTKLFISQFRQKNTFPRSFSRPPSTIPESFTQIGPAISEIIIHKHSPSLGTILEPSILIKTKLKVFL